MIETDASKRRQPTDSFPLAMIFVLVALAAALISIVAGAVAMAGRSDHLEYGVIIGGACGFVIGSIVGLYHHRRLRGLWVGMWTGSILGATIGPAFVKSDPQRTILSCLAGSAIIVFVGVVYSVFTKNE